MTRAEQKIQTAIVVAYRRRFDTLVWHCPNGGARTKLEAIAFRDAGLTAGIPDLHAAARDGRMLILEVKTPAEIRAGERALRPEERILSASASQPRVIAELRERGFTVAIVCSVEEALIVGETFGLKPRRGAPSRSDAAISTEF